MLYTNTEAFGERNKRELAFPEGIFIGKKRRTMEKKREKRIH